MKLWNVPSLEELNLRATAYHPDGGSHVDGSYRAYDKSFTENTFAPSSGNAGDPFIKGNDYRTVPIDADGNSNFTGVNP